MEQFILDTSAIAAFFRKEAGAEKVKAFLNDAALQKCYLIVHNPYVAEFYYDLLYAYTEPEAFEILERLNSYPILFIETISKELIKWIGYFKTHKKYHLQIALY